MESVNYVEIQPERDVSGNNFSKGQINYNWTMDSRGYWNPYKTFMKIRCRLAKDNATQLETTDNIAPSMFLADNLFQSMKIQLNNTCLSEIGDYVPQIASLKNRMYRTNEDLDTYGASTNFTQSSFVERLNQVSSNGSVPDGVVGKNSRRIQTFELIWRPPLGFFDIDGFIPASQGLFNLSLTPQPQGVYEKFAVETTDNNATPNTDYVFQVLSMNMYILKGIGTPIVNKSLSLNMKEMRCQSQNLTTNSLHQKTFQIHPKTNALTIAYQQSGAGFNDTRFSASKFKAGRNITNGIADEDELKLTRFWVRYGAKQLPTPIPDIIYDKTSGQDYTVQRYNETLQYTHLNNDLHSPEPIDKWVERGAYYHFAGYGNHEKEDRCYVSQQFSSFSTDALPPNLLLFDHFNKTIKINITDSILRDVSVSEGAN